MSPKPDTRRTGPAWLLGSAIILLALNLRVAVGSVGVVLDPLRADLSMSATTAGLLTTLPVLSFALFGSLTGRIVRPLGLDRTALALLIVTAIGIAARAVVNSTPAFMVLTMVSLAGCAVGNVILPALAKEHFPDKIALISSLYGASIVGGAALSATITVPIAEAAGGWRMGLGVWAILAAAAAIPWLLPAWRAGRSGRIAQPAGPTVARLVRNPVAWACALMFGAQSAQAYAQFGWLAVIFEDSGLTAGKAGALVGVVASAGIPVTLLLPALIARFDHRATLPWAFAVCTAAGWAGILWLPTTMPWLWAVLLGVGGAAFTWTLAMIGRRAHTAEGTAALSAFAQSIGYIIAGIGPFGAGFLHDVTGSWTVPILALIGMALLLGPAGAVVARDRMLEDHPDTPDVKH